MEEEYGSTGEESDCSEYETTQEVETTSTATSNNCKNSNATETRRKNSFVWKYFRKTEGNKECYECVICNGTVGCQTTSNLARHLEATHDITKLASEGSGKEQNSGRGRPKRSFIWKYCSKEDSKHVRCRLCQKSLYFGGGNTSNITKHLRRLHSHQLGQKMEDSGMEDGTETATATASIMKVEALNGEMPEVMEKFDKSIYIQSQSSGRKERRGASYVWSYCDKLSRHTIRCKLCNKLMSFHGTANVITHLQRRHNIVGRVENSENNSNGNAGNETLDDPNGTGADTSYEPGDLGTDNPWKRQKRSITSASVVWKYCTRIGPDGVRCGFCKKTLSYQGTSNLQRHLHRMHGIVTQGRGFKDTELNENKPPLSNDFIWEHCSIADDEKIKCNMCQTVFDSKQMDEISKHLTMTHAVEPRQSLVRRQSRRRANISEDSSDEDNDFDDNWSKLDENEDSPLLNAKFKKAESLYDDIIEEDPEQTNCDEDPFEPSTLHEIVLDNPLSAQTSRANSPEPNRAISQKCLQSKHLQKLNEERVRMEIEYFKEKAGFYRMQKYLTALQAKKVRLEVERFTNVTELNGATAFTVNVADLQNNLQNLPTQ